MYVAVVDEVGNWVRRIPADEAAAIWPGIGRKKAAPTGVGAGRQADVGEPLHDDFCATFSNPGHQRQRRARAELPFNGDGASAAGGSPLADTHQPLFPSDDCSATSERRDAVVRRIVP